MRRAIVLAVVLATGVAAAGAVLLLGDDALEPMPRLNDRGVAATALVEPRQHLFGDAVSARVEVLLDRRRIDPSAVRLRMRFEPYRPGAPVRTERLDTGLLTRLRFTVRLHCLDESCLPLTTGRPFSFPRGAVLADGERVANFEWPEIAVGSRVVPSAPDSGATAVGRWRVNVSELPAPTYRVAPGLVFGLLAVLAGVLVAGAAALLGMALPRRASVDGGCLRSSARSPCSRPPAVEASPRRSGRLSTCLPWSSRVEGKAASRRWRASWRGHGVALLPTRPTGSPSASASSYRRRTAGVRRPGLPSVDIAVFGRVARRTALVRAGLVLALVAALGAGAAAARTPEVENAGLLPDSSSGVVVVLDASASVEGTSRLAEVLPDLYKNPNRRIRAALQTLVERDDPVGFVLFSDVAYELLPLESPGRALAPLRRFFAPDSEALATGRGETFPENPWSRSFSGGTLISAGLSKALEIIERDATENGAILLLSDLDAPDDPDLAGRSRGYAMQGSRCGSSRSCPIVAVSRSSRGSWETTSSSIRTSWSKP